MGNFYTSSGKKINKETSEAALWKFFEHFYDLSGAEVEAANTTLEEYYRRVLAEDEAVAGDAELRACMTGLGPGLATLYSEDLARVSLQLAAEAEVISYEDALLPGGMVSVIAALERRLLASGRGEVRLGEEVRRLDWAEDGVTVTSTSGVTSAGHVIVTVPIGVLQNNHTSLFSPPLPQEKVTTKLCIKHLIFIIHLIFSR